MLVSGLDAVPAVCRSCECVQYVRYVRSIVFAARGRSNGGGQ